MIPARAIKPLCRFSSLTAGGGPPPPAPWTEAMCGRYTLTTNPRVLPSTSRLNEVPRDIQPRFNVAPTQQVPVIRQLDEGRRLDMMRWGLVPSWAEDLKLGYRMINARAETVSTKPAFRASFRRRRCLVPADGFYEWREEGGAKQPYWIGLRDRKPCGRNPTERNLITVSATALP